MTQILTQKNLVEAATAGGVAYGIQSIGKVCSDTTPYQAAVGTAGGLLLATFATGEIGMLKSVPHVIITATSAVAVKELMKGTGVGSIPGKLMTKGGLGCGALAAGSHLVATRFVAPMMSSMLGGSIIGNV